MGARRVLATAAVCGAVLCLLPLWLLSPGSARAAGSDAPSPVRVTPAPIILPLPTSDPTAQSSVKVQPAATKRIVKRALVVLAYWNKPDKTTRSEAKRILITQANTFLKTASYGRWSLTGTVTGWLKIPRPAVCEDDATTLSGIAAARAAGFHPERYTNLIVYVPCESADVGWGDWPGRKLLLMGRDGGLLTSTVVHELGHNWGLQHSNLMVCTTNGAKVAYSAGAKCSSEEYGDELSVMGDNYDYVDDFPALDKLRLKWLTGSAVAQVPSGTSRTVTLAPYELSSGIRTIRIVGTNSRVYTVEWRTNRGLDLGSPPDYHGVFIHLTQPSKGYSTVVLPMLPGTGENAAAGEFHYALPTGSSWTTPEGIRIAVTGANSTTRTITVTPDVTPTVPDAVDALSVLRNGSSATLQFGRTDDGGEPVREYDIADQAGDTWTVRDFGGSTTVDTTLDGLDPAAAYTFTVTARNQLGAGPPATVGG